VTTVFNETIVERFIHFIQNGRLGHAYLFVGPIRVGKTSTAVRIAQLVNCEKVLSSGPCGSCESCAKIGKAIHPDVTLLTADESGSIKIEAVRQLTRLLQLKPYEGKKKVCIIKNIEDLTVEGANALLKTLEEPSADSLLLLTTAFPDRVLSTVKSRCQIINLFSLTAEELKKNLISSQNLSEEISHFLAFFSEGNHGLAQKLREQKIYQHKDEVIDNFLLTRDSDTFLNGIVSDKDKTKETLQILLSFFRDLILLENGINFVRLIHKDRLADLKKISSRFSFAEVSDCFSEVVKTTQMLEENFNVKIALTVIKELCTDRKLS